ncbi:MAG: mechanosensitive ion channel family protein [Gammaproteobacteria bacterium]
MNESIDSIEQVRHTAIDLALRFGPRLFTALLILGLGVVISRYAGRGLARALQHIELEPPVRLLLMRIGRALVMLLFVVIALQNLGVELLPLIAGLGIAGAGIALALQGVLSNVAAGLTIIFTKPFRVGEYISIAAEEGRVDAISLFSTTLGHPDRSLVIIPNRKIAGEILHNFGNVRQLDITVGVAYDTNLDAAVAAIDGVLKNNPRVLRDPAPLIQTTALGDWSISIGVKPWVAVRDYRAAHGEITQAILTAMRENQIQIPFPQQEVRLIGATAGP